MCWCFFFFFSPAATANPPPSARFDIPPKHVSYAKAPGTADEVPFAALEAMEMSGGGTLGEAVAATAAVVRENVRLRRAYVMHAVGAGEAIGYYIHSGIAPGLGRQAALVKVRGPEGADAAAAAAAASKVAMHAVAVRPRFLEPECIPAEVVLSEKEILRAQMENSGKPASIVDKIVNGRMAKFHEEFCLLNQKFVMDDGVTVGKWVKGEAGGGLEVVQFVRLKVGEGIEVEEKDFAAEVAATVADSSA